MRMALAAVLLNTLAVGLCGGVMLCCPNSQCPLTFSKPSALKNHGKACIYNRARGLVDDQDFDWPKGDNQGDDEVDSWGGDNWHEDDRINIPFLPATGRQPAAAPRHRLPVQVLDASYRANVPPAQQDIDKRWYAFVKLAANGLGLGERDISDLLRLVHEAGPPSFRTVGQYKSFDKQLVEMHGGHYKSIRGERGGAQPQVIVL
jgi:hypothetical protein